MKKTEMFQNKNKTATLSVRTPSCKLIGIEQPGKKSQNQRETGTSLVVQWLRLCTPSAGGMCSIPGQRTKIPHAMQHSQKKKKKIRGKEPGVLAEVFGQLWVCTSLYYTRVPHCLQACHGA